MNKNPLINQELLLEKFPGKGGWTFARLPEIKPDKNAPFGWRKVRGTIDGYEIKAYHLMPMGNGQLFLPVKAEIRKKIKKQAGDYVHVILYIDDSTFEVPDELIRCLKDEPGAYEMFCSYTQTEQKAFADWIYSAKKEDTKVERIVKMLKMLERGERL